jgi:hypothetical protein
MNGYVLAGALTIFGALPVTGGEEPPAVGGWQSANGNHRVGLDSTTRHGGKSAGCVQSTTDELGEEIFGGFQQLINARDYRGKRLRLAAFVKTQDVGGWSGLWMRIHGKRSPMAFDNMQQRPIKGTSDWNAYQVVLDVPDDAIDIALGVLQSGSGRTWIDDVSLEVVGDEVAVTATEARNGNSATQMSPEQVASLEKWVQAWPSKLENPSFEQDRLEYDLSLVQGAWEAEKPEEYASGYGRITKRIEGNKEMVTFYDSKGDVISQHTVDFDLEQSGRVLLFTFRNMEVTAGAGKGQKMSGSFSYIYAVNQRTFIEIVGALDGSNSRPRVTEWKRVGE